MALAGVESILVIRGPNGIVNAHLHTSRCVVVEVRTFSYFLGWVTLKYKEKSFTSILVDYKRFRCYRMKTIMLFSLFLNTSFLKNSQKPKTPVGWRYFLFFRFTFLQQCGMHSALQSLEHRVCMLTIRHARTQKEWLKTFKKIINKRIAEERWTR